MTWILLTLILIPFELILAVLVGKWLKHRLGKQNDS